MTFLLCTTVYSLIGWGFCRLCYGRWTPDPESENGPLTFLLISTIWPLILFLALVKNPRN